jgi:hypothetical protein
MRELCLILGQVLNAHRPARAPNSCALMILPVVAGSNTASSDWHRQPDLLRKPDARTRPMSHRSPGYR